MKQSAPVQASIFHVARRWWSDVAAKHGHAAAARQFLAAICEFARDSTPERRRQRYGDTDYDWDHRVNTTSAAVGWRDRLLGVFHSPYQPTEPALFHEMIECLRQCAGINLRDFVFIDLGSGKGRTLLMASDYPFRRFVGVELLPTLHQFALDNLAKYHSDSQQCPWLDSICGDATQFDFPAEPMVLYLFNPFPEAGLRRMLANLRQSSNIHPRPLYVLYHNSVLEHVLQENTTLRKIGGTHQYSIYGCNSSSAFS